MKNETLVIRLIPVLLLSILVGCQPKTVAPITSLINKVWKANTVKEADLLVFTLGATNNIKPGYTNFRLDLSRADTVQLKDVDGRLTVGTWTVSTDNKRLILANLNPKPTNTGGSVEYYILAEPDGSSLKLERTAESRKTGNTIDQYELIPQ
ncbi:hypothetical protein GO755_11675 [Spirosoma sp. HMF4905]|uniref:Lipocalin-like domain-containing protein n=1 Tax=Spirosoma arboris TaxID=2682092 RepID=A0A7K1SA29_9BACT|nr:hypothetical protein [Spirosoma arboris]MVM30692.1 hypothetical protein [Spirosoma arboris]